ncbi:MAG: adenylate/guanylate cyclase protein, partial [Rhizobacter sp.]|nr:adenylate/guanylate cyclase protein [Rhizobacter sp.]
MWRHLKGKTLWIGLLAPLLAIGLGAVAYLWDAVPVQLLRNATFDQMQRWHPRPYVEAPVRVVDIDDESLRRLGQWPWPRTRLAELTARLQDAGAAAIVFDVMFAEPDRTSPASMLTLWDAPPPLRQAMVGLPDHDAVFADAIGRGRVVLGFSVTHGRVADTTEQAASTEATTQAPRNEARFIALGEPPASYLHDFSEGVDSLPALATAAAGNGALTFIPDADGVVRKVPLLMRRQGVVVPSLVAEALRVAQGARNITTRTSPEKGVGLEEVRIGAASIRTTPQGEAWVHYSRASPQRTLPVWKVMAGQVPATELKDRILLVGASAQGLLDLRFSPLTGIIPGVEVHAQFLEQALTGGGLDRPSWAPAVEASVLVFGGLVVTGIALSTGALLSFAVFAALLALWAGVAWRAFAAHGLLIDAATP